jgi:hypothetical protein
MENPKEILQAEMIRILEERQLIKKLIKLNPKYKEILGVEENQLEQVREYLKKEINSTYGLPKNPE